MSSRKEVEELSLSRAPVRAWRLSGAVPRAWLTGRAQSIDHPDAALQAISESDLRADPPVEGLESPLEGTGAVTAIRIEEHGDSMRRAQLSVHEDSLFVLSEAWAPGWRAELDGKDVPVLRVGGVFIGVQIPSGGGELTLRYRPWGWIWGCRLGALGFVGLLGLAFARRWPRDEVERAPQFGAV